jgi:hypothetical protein
MKDDQEGNWGTNEHRLLMYSRVESMAPDLGSGREGLHRFAAGSETVRLDLELVPMRIRSKYKIVYVVMMRLEIKRKSIGDAIMIRDSPAGANCMQGEVAVNLIINASCVLPANYFLRHLARPSTTSAYTHVCVL